jgi:glycosyltransferase involved in cell wall biosynthesis
MTRRTSVLVLTKSTGGLAVYNRILLPELDPLRFDLHVLCLSEGGQAYAGDLAAAGVSAEALAMDRYRIDPAGDLGLLRQVTAILRGRRPDVVVAHGAKAGVLGRAAALLTGTPAVCAQHSLPFLKRVQGRKAPLYWSFEAASRLLGGHLVALTEGARRATRRAGLFAGGRIEVIRTGVDAERFRPRGRRDALAVDLGLDPARPILGWLGRMEPQKAPGDFLEAVARLAADRPGLQVLMAGEGRLRDDLAARIAALGLRRTIRLLPWQADPARFYEAADVFVLSSRWEGMPITLLEAMASGCACVATAVDGCPELIEAGASGRLVPPADPAAMARAIGGLLDDGAARAAMGLAARARVEQAFTLPRMVRDWEILLARIGQPRRVTLAAQGGPLAEGEP